MQFPLDATAAERYRHTLKLMGSAERMTQKGVRVDLERCKWHIAHSRDRAAFFTEMFLRLTGLPSEALGDAGAGATKAVKSWFWDECKAPPIVFDKITKKPQFNTPTLIGYATDFKGKPFSGPAAALFGIRKAKTSEKFARAYYEVASRHEGRIHFGFNVCGTKGERWSASTKWRWYDEGTQEWVKYRLNVQNVPSKEPKFKFDGDEKPTKLALSLRDCFIPDPGKVWAKFDYDQLELRLIAYTAGARKLIEWIGSGADTHMENARILFTEARIPVGASKKDPQWKAYREAAKPCAYGLSYSMPSDKGEVHVAELHKQLKSTFPDIEESYVKVLADRFFAAHPEIRHWQNATKRMVRETGRVTLPQNGRFLWLPATMRGYNMAGNFFMQSGGGYLINRATPDIEARLVGTGADLLMNVHDEVDVQIPTDRVEEVCGIVETELARPAQFGGVTAGVPAAGAVGPNWGATEDRL
jgi:DNA polymerase I-like protein with 3'-5' exonuclease and polymerase domains